MSFMVNGYSLLNLSYLFGLHTNGNHGIPIPAKGCLKEYPHGTSCKY